MAVKVINNKQIEKDLLITLFITIIPMIIYLFFGDHWRNFNKSVEFGFWGKFIIQSSLAFCLAGLNFIVVMLLRKERFSEYGIIKDNFVQSVVMSFMCFLPHLIFLIITRGFHGYIPMSGAIVFDSVMEQIIPIKVICMIIIFFIWGFCEGFLYVFLAEKFNEIYPSKDVWMNAGAIIGGVICVFMHGGISLDPIIFFDAITMFIFIYGILMVKEKTGNAWGCVLAFMFLWNAFPA